MSERNLMIETSEPARTLKRMAKEGTVRALNLDNKLDPTNPEQAIPSMEELTSEAEDLTRVNLSDKTS